MRLLRALYRPLVRRAARQVLEGRSVVPDDPERGRWQPEAVERYLDAVWRRADELIALARLEALPTWGNRHNVFLAVVTTSAFQGLHERGVPADYARVLVADVGWKIYSWMLEAVATPFRWTTRDPRLRMERSLRALMRFPFSAPGAPGYEVQAWEQDGHLHTSWTHCPPLAFVRRVVEIRGDHGELASFRDSWCGYDWPGADLLAGDGKRGHYRRPHTMSRGDDVCDMCWMGHVPSGVSVASDRATLVP